MTLTPGTLRSATAVALGALLALPACAIPHSHAGHNHEGHEHTPDYEMEGLAHELAIAKPAPSAVQFPLSAVKIAPDSLYGIAQQRNLEFQLSLNDSQWLCQMTSAANLTACADGHYQGHYLSGSAMMYNNTGDKRIQAKANLLIAEMAKVQAAWTGKTDYYGVPSDGYIFPNYPDVFGIMEGRCGMVGPKLDYSVPYYSLHKLMAGLLDHYQLAGNEQALAMVSKMADWVVLRVAATLKRGGQELWQCVLGTEWGGMNEVMYNLYDVTGTEAYLSTGLKFNHWQWTAPLAIGDDDIDASHGNAGGNHANTHIPEIIGSARGYELTGNETQKAIAVNFFNIVTANHSWATGGSNDGEHWGAPNAMGSQLNADTEESCTQYNILKVARHLFKWTADSAMGDFYERAIMNGIIGNQNKLDPAMTEFIYMLPLGAGGMKKPWGKSNTGFPCCWGTLTEQFSKLSDSIYFASPDHTAIFVNQFMSSTIHWAQKAVTIEQVAGFPASSTSTTTVTVTAATPTTFALKLRIPAWATGANTVSLNGKPVGAVVAGAYLTVHRAWASGDKLEVFFPLVLKASLVTDNRTAFNATMAWMYGPLVLAGLSNTTLFEPVGGDGTAPAAFIKRTSATELRFTASGVDGMSKKAISMQMMPLHEIMEEAYAVYFKCSGPPKPVVFAPGGATVPSADLSDWTLQNVESAASRLPGLVDLRTAGPHTISTLTLTHAIIGGAHKLDTVELSFRYVAGYDGKSAGAWPVLLASGRARIALLPLCGRVERPNRTRALRSRNRPGDQVLSMALVSAETGHVHKVVYTSPALDKYKFDNFKGYSPPIAAAATGLALDNSEPLFIQLTVANNQRNLQIPLDPKAGLSVKVKWAAAPEEDAIPAGTTTRESLSSHRWGHEASPAEL